MTRRCNQVFQCANCGCISTAETGFSRWLRERKDLDSNDIGLVFIDSDLWIHRYKTTKEGRDLQCIMWCEIKGHGREPTDAQKDTLLIIDQFMNNRRETPTKKNAKHQTDDRPQKVLSWKLKRQTTVWAFGGFLLQFENTGPDDGWIRWGKKRDLITPDMLAALIRFDLDPETLKPLDLRSHHPHRQLPLLNDDAA